MQRPNYVCMLFLFFLTHAMALALVLALVYVRCLGMNPGPSFRKVSTVHRFIAFAGLGCATVTTCSVHVAAPCG